MEIQTILLNCVKTKLAHRLEECDLSCIPYSIIKAGLNQLGYTLSESENYEDDVMYTNGWEYDYHMYIWKDGEYTGYYLCGSLYYGDNEIKK
jgi:hypothetical protein